MQPLMRKTGLVVRELPDEVLVYDLDRDRAYCLNRTAAQVWKRCDGRTSPAAMAKRLQKDLGAPVDEKVVWYALDQLGRDRLLERPAQPPAGLAGMTRRQQLRALAKAAVAVPLITAVTAPLAAQVSPCVPVNGQCRDTPDCCTGLLCINSQCLPAPSS